MGTRGGDGMRDEECGMRRGALGCKSQVTLETAMRAAATAWATGCVSRQRKAAHNRPPRQLPPSCP
eukprot:3030167-Rhodomonas_salina.1